MSHPYQGIKAALATKHGKAIVLQPPFERLGIELATIELDTDKLGTFSGEIPRLSDQRTTALQKARLGMKATGLDLGLASEGSIGADHLVPFINSDIETLAWIDNQLDIEIVQSYRSFEIVAFREEIDKPLISAEMLSRADFPNHALIVWANGAQIHKGIRDLGELERAIDAAYADTSEGKVIVESDLRAHMSPSRRENIRKCGELLVERLLRLCPDCSVPGFGEVEALFGLPCESCGELVATALSGNVFGCAKCDFREEKLFGTTYAPARICPSCNP